MTDEILDCGCRWEGRPGPLPDTQEFVPEIDCLVHGQKADFPWGHGQPRITASLQDRMLVFDADAWHKAGGDVGDNSQFWKPATLIEIFPDDEYDTPDEYATVEFDDGRVSHGHYISAMRAPVPA